jgi:hypothetical protein
MPGVVEREIMRGPTPEPIFSWEDVSHTKTPRGVWLENREDFTRYLATISPQGGRSKVETADDFRERQLRKYGGNGDLALAKLCLYKGEGQTVDRVGQLFFNFWNTNHRKKVFADKTLRSAIWFVAKLIRELLIEELYRVGRNKDRVDDSGTSLHLLRVIDQRLLPASMVTTSSLQTLSEDVWRLLRECVSTRIQSLTASESIAHPILAARQSLNMRLTSLASQLSKAQDRTTHNGTYAAKASTPSFTVLDLDRSLRAVLPHAVSQILWRLVCKASLEMVETYGGRSDIILVLSDRVGQWVRPVEGESEHSNDHLWIDRETVTGDCIARGKFFCCNNVMEKGSESAKRLFSAEPNIAQFKSLMVIPVLIEGETRAVLRLMSMDENCFLDKHTRAIEDIAFVAGYALNVLDAQRRRDRITDALAFFAEGQAVGDQPRLEDLLRTSLDVLGAECAVFWPVDAVHGQRAIFRRGTVMPAFGAGLLEHLSANDAHLGVRQDGFTQAIYQLAAALPGHVTLCHHVLQKLPAPDTEKRRPDYVVELFAEQHGTWMDNADRTTEGVFRKSYDSYDTFPKVNKRLEQNSRPGTHLHTRVGFPIKEKEHNIVSGIAWFCFPDLHHLDWSERLFITALSNYLAQASKAHGLRLAIRSFRHMLRNVCDKSIMEMHQSLNPNTYGESESEVDGLPPVPSLAEAVAMGSDVLFSVKMKAAEVKVLLDPTAPEAAYLPWTLKDIFRRAWSIASNFGVRSDGFKEAPCNGRLVDRGGSLTVVYDNGVNPEQQVNGALYTVALNILSNSFRCASPCVIWVPSGSSTLRVWFGNGGEYPGADLYAIPEPASSDVGSERGVGISLVKEVLQHERGQVRMIDDARFKSENPKAPTDLRRCHTFVEVVLRN